MESVSLQFPVAVILLGGGLVAGFAGYPLLRPLLALYGFIGGVIVTPTFADQLDGWWFITATLAGGLAGAAVALAVYLATVALVGAGAAAFIVHLAVEGDPEIWLVVAASVLGALMALIARRYVVIIATAFVGGWTAMVGGLALSRDQAAMAATAGDVSGLFPLVPLEGQEVFAAGWLTLGLLGSVVQLLASRQVRGDD
ncbi:MAG: hypothetical protein J4G16_11605 [Acidobacteria bacterium]|nr:hypothetical protein [Acidobacteriota bacterium]